MKFLTICLLFALLAIYANAQMAEEFAPEEQLSPIRVKRQWGMGWGYRPWGYGGWGYGRPWGMGGMWGGGWGYPMGGMWG
ncbi:hypothetical protein ANCDUO_10009 [Ancylostoma duodenale]|uniref:Sulfur globule protein CV3 domain protein n=1 Tax=Ancylostoma duodenale TaxID=51022 RepID=A0A0C2GLB1_9BILA|nr:hypothetical protein ANCDUO_10009 [Ancylostoma duodenale]